MILAFGIDVALPAFDEIREGFDMDPSNNRITLTVTLYVLGMAFGQLFWGPCADRFGRRSTLLAGISLYALGALGSALAPSFAVMLIARLVWGLGAAAPAGLRVVVARDLYSGDQMARVVTIVMAVFLVGPIIVPSIGELILRFAPWQGVFLAALVIAAVAFAWTLWFGETLDPAHKRPLEFRPVLEAFGHVARNRVSIGHIAAVTMSSGAFFIFLGSSQPIFDRIYGRDDQFAVLFGAIGLFTILPLVISDRLIKRFGAERMALVTGGLFTFVSVVGLPVTIASDGVPNFWIWFVWIGLASSMATVFTPIANSLALVPMGELAGTAGAVLGFCSMAGGALLGAVFDALINDTVTPMAVGYTLYGVLSMALLWWARPEDNALAPPPGSPVDAAGSV